MNRKVEIEFPFLEIKVLATLCDQEEPELCEMLWKNIEKPLKAACHNTLTTGDLFVGYPRPPREPIQAGSQANPIGRKLTLFSDLEPGMLVYSGQKIYVAYGDHLTEPVSTSSSVVGKVDEEFMRDLMRAGKGVWHAHYLEHKSLTMMVRRKELTDDAKTLA
jgi:hypothetical protein